MVEDVKVNHENDTLHDHHNVMFGDDHYMIIMIRTRWSSAGHNADQEEPALPLHNILLRGGQFAGFRCGSRLGLPGETVDDSDDDSDDAF